LPSFEEFDWGGRTFLSGGRQDKPLGPAKRVYD